LAASDNVVKCTATNQELYSCTERLAAFATVAERVVETVVAAAAARVALTDSLSECTSNDSDATEAPDSEDGSVNDEGEVATLDAELEGLWRSRGGQSGLFEEFEEGDTEKEGTTALTTPFNVNIAPPATSEEPKSAFALQLSDPTTETATIFMSNPPTISSVPAATVDTGMATAKLNAYAPTSPLWRSVTHDHHTAITAITPPSPHNTTVTPPTSPPPHLLSRTPYPTSRAGLTVRVSAAAVGAAAAAAVVSASTWQNQVAHNPFSFPRLAAAEHFLIQPCPQLVAFLEFVPSFSLSSTSSPLHT
jgi:hypothetical protein